MEIDSLNSNLYLSSLQFSNKTVEKSKEKEKIKGKSFSKIYKKTQEELEIIKEGFPIEIVDMDLEEAAVYLKDEADIAGDLLKENQTSENFARYKKAVSNFLRYIAKNNYVVVTTDKESKLKRRKKISKVQIEVVNAKLEEIAQWMLSTHRKDGIRMLSKIDEIRGLIVDLFAK